MVTDQTYVKEVQKYRNTFFEDSKVVREAALKGLSTAIPLRILSMKIKYYHPYSYIIHCKTSEKYL